MIREDWQHFEKEWSKLIAKAWADSDYRNRLIADPKACFRDAGLILPDIVDIKVDEFSYRWRIAPSSDFDRMIFTIALPPKPAQLTEERLSLALKEGFSGVPEDDFYFCGLHCH